MLATDIAPPSSFDLRMLLQRSIRVPAVEPAAHTAGHDEGLAHNHHWATERAPAPCAMARQAVQPLIAHAASLRTPSCVVHDDIHYGRD